MERINNRLINTLRATTAGILSFTGTFTINPPQLKVEALTNPSAKVLDYIPTYFQDPYTQCGGEGYLDNETVLVTYQDDETLTLESLGIIPGECDNPQELALQPQPTATPEPVPTPKVEPQPTPTPLIFPRYPQIPLPTPDPRYTKRPEVKGDQECVDSVTKALDYIQEKASLEYYLVLSNPRTIECTEQSYATVSHDPPRLLIGRELLKTPRSSLGAVLVHESCHIWQVLRFKNMYPNIWPPPIGTGQGSVAEAECYTVEYYLYRKLGVNFDDLNSFADWVFKRIGIRIPLQ